MTRTHRDWVVLLLFVATFSALWPRYQAYRLHCEVLEKAKLCSKNIANVGLACRIYQDDFNCVPSKVSALIPKYLKAEPHCPFDESAYQAEQILVTPENVDYFPQGLLETVPGFLGVKVRCTSPLHSTFQPNLQPGYGGAGGFLQCQSEIVAPCITARPMSQGKGTAWRFAVTKSYRNTVLPLALVTLLSAVWPRYQAYRLHREVLEKAKLCRENVVAVAIACEVYQADSGAFPQNVNQAALHSLSAEPLCPFDQADYQANLVPITEDNIDKYPNGVVEVSPGDVGYQVRRSWKLHAQYEPDLEPGYGGCGFRPPTSKLLRGAGK